MPGTEPGTLPDGPGWIRTSDLGNKRGPLAFGKGYAVRWAPSGFRPSAAARSRPFSVGLVAAPLPPGPAAEHVGVREVVGEQVHVDAHRERGRVMPEPNLHLLRVQAATEEHRRARVPERVEARPRDAGAASRRLEHPTHEVRLVEHLPHGRGKDETLDASGWFHSGLAVQSKRRRSARSLSSQRPSHRTRVTLAAFLEVERNRLVRRTPRSSSAHVICLRRAFTSLGV